MKRVVTGHDENGKAIFVKIGEPEHVVDTPGVLWKELWATYPEILSRLMQLLNLHYRISGNHFFLI
ncbi:MAG: hypothetical protein Ct9H300mP20_17150 [Gammaproteobacteria bacterium]|nr:MAG: hypothetical protein Ct9H300mP20_17150 [Gammaproteobacteria bacterium]